ncbi:ImmA/IrrE family metallo-endopeptidase [Microaceticoccus formicicus]|uniref:ImmA/IrrE family metallo-endopeptidase n=1 Tax=Microaceticoccus formicicus TaxID=3118105 RepID=UPI003CCFF76D|nr:ImmA/IrrE family metallo-endopeptidase [Peptoniphilaceae bacterium AMB_02]
MENAIHKLVESGEIEIIEAPFKNKKLKGLCIDNIIYINSLNHLTRREKRCIIAEEVGHLKTSVGDILNTKAVANAQQERHARAWSYGQLVPLEKLIDAHNTRIRGRHELAEYLDVTEEFLQDAVKYYKSVYGICTRIGKYHIYFEPLGVLEKLDD